MRITPETISMGRKSRLFARLDTDQPGLYGVGASTFNGFAKTVEAA